MKYLPDTHAVYWHFVNPEKLGKKSSEILQDDNVVLLIPSIVLAELKYIFKKKKIPEVFDDIFEKISGDARCSFLPLDENIVKAMPVNYEMHDSIIIATARYIETLEQEEVSVITQDRDMRMSGMVNCVW